MALRMRWHLLTVLTGIISMLLPWGVVPPASRASGLGFSSALAMGNPTAMDDAAAQCRAMIQVSDWQAAVEACSQAIERNPKLTTAWIDRCQAQLELTRLSGALADCKQAIRLESDNSEAYLRLADVKAAVTPVNYPSVLEDYGKAIALDPKNATAYNNRGVTRNSLKDYPGALADYDKAIELNPNDALYYFNRGETLFLKGQRELGCSSFRQGHDLKPDFSLTTPDFDAAYLQSCNQIKEPGHGS
ncbi:MULTISPECIES: tetratricopeptide repeat protein [unclassified Synechococcus]|uniref:tetratricopeptide repeat protein n=1 Tax=unclassified Synechococcus TaxID=2626047 RepID=UPI000A0138AC|nr:MULTISPECIES: tetratricopeptide repeat protein [unclassified Synechococcus]WFN57754.1 tetratricopeptide repeat protein [Synechococcus sp. CCFWC 502]